MASLCLRGLHQLFLLDIWLQHLRTYHQQYQREIEP